MLAATGSVAKVGGFQWDPFVNEIIYTDQIVQILELDQSKPITLDGIIEAIHPDDRMDLREALDECRIEEVPLDLDIRTLTKNNHNNWVRAIIKPNINNGQLTNILTTLVDITKRKRLENNLLNNNRYLSAHIELSKEFSGLKSTDQLPSTISHIIEKQIGYEKVEVDFFDVKNTSMPLQKDLIINNVENFTRDNSIKQSVQSKGYKSFIQLPISYNERSLGVIQIFSSQLNPFHPSEIYIIKQIAQDIGYGMHTIEVKKQQEETTEFNQMLVNSLKLISVQLKFDPRRLKIAGDTYHLLGYDIKYFDSIESISKLIHPSDLSKLRHLQTNYSPNDEAFNIEIRLLHKNGNYFWFSTQGKIYFDSESSLSRIDAVLFNIDERKNTEKALLSAKIAGRDKERIRIAKEIHDNLGQMLSLAKINLNQLQVDIDKLSPQSKERFHTACEVIEKVKVEAREISHDLMPSALLDFGLVASIESDILKIEQASSIKFNFEHNLDKIRYPFAIESNLYSIVREACANIIKHSEATEAIIQLLQDEEALELQILDNGNGFQSPALSKMNGIGLSNVRDRVKSLNGEIIVDNKNGFALTIQIPFATAEIVK